MSRVLLALRVCALWGAAISIPLFLELSSQQEVMENRGFSGDPLILFSLFLGWLPVLILAFPEKLWTRIEPIVVAGLTGLVALGALRPVGVFSLLLYALSAGLITLAVSRLVLERKAIQRLLTWLGIGSLIAPLVFLLSPPIWSRIRTAEVQGRPEPWSESGTPVVVVILDECPLDLLLTPDRELAELFPNFRRLSRDSIWFREATSVCDFTELAVPAILSGSYPRRGVASLQQYPRNLYTYLADRPLKTIGVASNLSPQRADLARKRPLHQLLGEGFVLYLHRTLPESLAARLPARDALVTRDDFDPLWREARRFERYRDFITTLGDFPNELVVMHMMLPHGPLEYYPDGTRYNVEKVLEPFHRDQHEWSATLDQQRHLLQLQLADRFLGELLDQLESKGLYGKSVLAVVADHGSSFFPGSSRRHAQPDNLSAILRVPLILKPPGGLTGGRIDDRPVETVDLLPTLAHLLGAVADPQWDGVNLLDPGWPGRTRRHLILTWPQVSLKAAGWRSVPHQSDDSDAGVLSLELSSLPWEQGLKLKQARFGHPLEPMSVGPYRELLGKSPGQFGWRPSKVRASVGQEDLLENVDPASGFLPGLLRADLDSDSATPLAVAIELNGKIVATAWSTPAKNHHKVRVLLPQEAFRQGSNKPTLHEIGESNGGLVLAPLVQGSLGRLTGDFLELRGKRVPIASEKLGVWHQWTDGDGDLRLDGWSYDFQQSEAPEAFAVFEGELLVALVPADIEAYLLLRPSDRKALRGRTKGEQLCGFALELSSNPLTTMRVFAVFSDRAAELRLE